MEITALKNFFQDQGMRTNTYVNSDDFDKWYVLEIRTINNKLAGCFLFDYETGLQREMR